ncbi:hypothetical protein TNCT_297681 [Trichonephila clavata]|uniref:Uncharacterized protein n=1 Tax=Trichonephila clavata TaxID=2740835 RepID=A0A8X6IRH6_TRICU|nr:hypothetical protein TNCT_297681 [Trichonephila clavata]
MFENATKEDLVTILREMEETVETDLGIIELKQKLMLSRAYLEDEEFELELARIELARWKAEKEARIRKARHKEVKEARLRVEEEARHIAEEEEARLRAEKEAKILEERWRIEEEART